MGFLAKLIGGAGAADAGQIVKDTGQAVGSLAKDIRTAITGVDPDKAAELEKLTLELDKAVAEAQAKINEVEAASPRFFTAGWRPAVGWVCVVSLAAYYWPRFVIGMTLWTIMAVKSGSIPPLPDLGVWDILGLLGGILGIGTMRSYEKVQGVHATH